MGVIFQLLETREEEYMDTLHMLQAPIMEFMEKQILVMATLDILRVARVSRSRETVM
jgi:hypothetical protein